MRTTAPRNLHAPRWVAAACILMLALPSEARAQRSVDVGVGARMALVPAPVQDPLAVVPGGPPRARDARGDFMRYVVLGSGVGTLLGTGYGVYHAATCETCFPGTQPLVVLADMITGMAVGGVTGAVLYVISAPVRASAHRVAGVR